jgi:hypothetical protein
MASYPLPLFSHSFFFHLLPWPPRQPQQQQQRQQQQGSGRGRGNRGGGGGQQRAPTSLVGSNTQEAWNDYFRVQQNPDLWKSYIEK